MSEQKQTKRDCNFETQKAQKLSNSTHRDLEQILFWIAVGGLFDVRTLNSLVCSSRQTMNKFKHFLYVFGTVSGLVISINEYPQEKKKVIKSLKIIESYEDSDDDESDDSDDSDVSDVDIVL